MKKRKIFLTLVSTLLTLLIAALPAMAVTYKYDDLGRLQEATYDNDQKVTYTYDNAGNITSVKSTNPAVAPQLTVTSPTDNLTTSQTSIAVTGTTDVGSTVQVNNIPATVDGAGNFNTTLNLVSGDNTITITASDPFGKTTTVTRKVTMDNVAPILMITSPTNGQHIQNDWIQVSGLTELGSTVKVNGTSAPLDLNGGFSTTVNLVFGSNAIIITASDNVGNTTTQSYDVSYDQIALASISSSGGRGDLDSSLNDIPAITPDGRYVAFSSNATNLVSNDTNGKTDIFVRDRVTGTTELVSISTAGEQGNNNSLNPSISADGRYIAFTSYSSNFTNNDTNNNKDVFVHDRQTGTTDMVSVSSSGVGGNKESYTPSISVDGRYVAFNSVSDKLVSGDKNSTWDIFVHDRQTGLNERVNTSSTGVEANNTSAAPAITLDGRYVVFKSLANNLVSGYSNSIWNVYVHDRQTGNTDIAGIADNGEIANWSIENYVSISNNGQFVTFSTNANNLGSTDTNGYSDIYVRDRQHGTTERISVSNLGLQSKGQSYYANISGNGRYVVLQSYGDLATDGTPVTSQVYVYDRGSSVLQPY